MRHTPLIFQEFETVIYFKPSAYLVALSLTEGLGGPDLLEHRETSLDLVVVGW